MEIIIKPVANPGLYRDIQESINECATKHRTISGAFRGLQRLNSRSRSWTRSCGRWGRLEVWVDGGELPYDEVSWIVDELDRKNFYDLEGDFAKLIVAELQTRRGA